MNATSVGRPGVLQIVLGGLVMLAFACGPLLMAMKSPMNEWGFIAVGQQAVMLSLLALAAVVLYVIGVIRYTKSKGYSSWIGFWLCISNAAGLITMLLLPDLNRMSTLRSQTSKESTRAV